MGRPNSLYTSFVLLEESNIWSKKKSWKILETCSSRLILEIKPWLTNLCLSFSFLHHNFEVQTNFTVLNVWYGLWFLNNKWFSVKYAVMVWKLLYMFILINNNITIPLNNIGIWDNLSMKLIASHCMQQDKSQGIIANLKHSTNTLIIVLAMHTLVLQFRPHCCYASALNTNNFWCVVLQIKFTALLALIIISLLTIIIVILLF